jgi:hypothetical protein
LDFPVVFIVVTSCPPIAGADQADDTAGPVGVADEQDPLVHHAEQPPAQFAAVAMGFVEKNQGLGVSKGPLGVRETTP